MALNSIIGVLLLGLFLSSVILDDHLTEAKRSRYEFHFMGIRQKNEPYFGKLAEQVQFHLGLVGVGGKGARNIIYRDYLLRFI